MNYSKTDLKQNSKVRDILLKPYIYRIFNSSILNMFEYKIIKILKNR